MSLAILSKKNELQAKTFKNVALATLYSTLDFSIRENSLKENGSIELWVTKRFGNGEDEYDYFSMDIHEKKWSVKMFEQGIFKINNKKYYPLAGTDNTPSRLCYDFSLAYLKLCPEHLISIYNWVFSIEDIEKIEKETGWVENWSQNFNKLDS